jgi:fatty-acyl-CoA synthase
VIKSMNVAWWVERWSQLHPAKPALIFEGRSISYAELHGRANAAACWLQSLGLEKGDRVAAFLDNRPEFLELYLACARLGAIFVPLNFRLAPPELDFLLADCRPRLLVFSQGLVKAVAALDLDHRRPPLATAQVGPDPAPATGAPEGCLDYHPETAAYAGQRPFLTASLGPADTEEPQVIMYTSGTTGASKGAVLTHRKTFFNCLNADIFFDLTLDDRMLICLPLYHSGGLFIQASPCLYKGATIVLHSRFDPARTYRDIAALRVTKLLGVPTVYRALLRVPQEERADVSSLRICAIGGEKVTPELLAECAANGFRARQVMGQTETSILLWCSEEESLARPGAVGRPVFHAEIKLIDAQGRRVTNGQVGEIAVRGSIVMKEYWRDPAATEQAFQSGWLRTGDLARQDAQGYFYLVDRAKDMYISGGENVYPAEVEAVLGQHPGVEEAAVVGAPDPDWGEAGVAFIVARDGQALLEAELLAFCRSRLAGYKIPRRVVLARELPRTSLGKVRKHLLRAEWLAGG